MLFDTCLWLCCAGRFWRSRLFAGRRRDGWSRVVAWEKRYAWAEALAFEERRDVLSRRL